MPFDPSGYPPLTQDTDLSSFPGSPFPTALIRGAEVSIRRECGWHIAPQVRETVTIRASDPLLLALPTLCLVRVWAITKEDGTVLDPAFYAIEPGSVVMAKGFQWWDTTMSYAVEMTHGYLAADDLLSVVAERCQRQLTDPVLAQRSETVGQRTSSESYNVARIGGEYGSTGSSLDAYRLHTFR